MLTICYTVKWWLVTVVMGIIMQNCSILLSKLRMRNSELRSVIMSIDQHDQLSKDMVEQVRCIRIM